MSAADEATPAPRPGKRASAFRTIGEVAEDLDVPAHVLRFWESKFPQLKPMKRGGGRRYYRPEDIALVQRIRRCLYQEGYTIRGVQRLLNGGVDKTDAVFPSHGLPETATLFPLDPLPPEAAVEGRRGRGPAAKQARGVAVRGLPEEARTALQDLRRDLLEIRQLAARLRRGA